MLGGLNGTVIKERAAHSTRAGEAQVSPPPAAHKARAHSGVMKAPPWAGQSNFTRPHFAIPQNRKERRRDYSHDHRPD